MQRIATYAGEWICSVNSCHREDVADKALAAILGIIKDCLVMSVVVMAGAGLTLLLG